MTRDNSRIVKSRRTGDLYEVQHVYHSKDGIDAEDVFACYRLSNYDGMPIGSIVHIAKGEIDGYTPSDVPAREA